MDMRLLMKQAQQIQLKMQEAQNTIRAEGTSGGAIVKVVLSGTKEMVSISIAKDAIDVNDIGMLEDLIIVAYQDAYKKVDDAMAQITEGFPINYKSLI